MSGFWGGLGALTPNLGFWDGFGEILPQNLAGWVLFWGDFTPNLVANALAGGSHLLLNELA